MSTNRSRRIDRDTAEQLLGGAVAGTPAGPDARLAAAASPTGPVGGTEHQGLARVLAAAAAPATEGELAGEEAALAAFREARLATAAQTTAVPAPVRRRSMATAALARASKALSTKAAAAVLTATALGGVAVAAGTGHLPGPLGGPDESNRSLTAPASLGGSGDGRGSAGASAGQSQPTGPGDASTGGASASPGRRGVSGQPVDPALASLCQAFADRSGKGERPRALAGEPQFGPLVEAAGGPEKVEGYCAATLHRETDRPGATPDPKPGGDGRTTGGGDGKGETGGGSGGSGTGGGKTAPSTGRPADPAPADPAPSAPAPSANPPSPDPTPKTDRTKPGVSATTERTGEASPKR